MTKWELNVKGGVDDVVGEDIVVTKKITLIIGLHLHLLQEAVEWTEKHAP